MTNNNGNNDDFIIKKTLVFIAVLKGDRRSLQETYIFFCQREYKPRNKFSHLPTFQAQKVQVFLFLQRSPKLGTVIAILNSIQQPGRIFVILFAQMAYYSSVIFSQTCSKLRNNSSDDCEVDNHLGKKKREGCQVSCRFSPCRQFSVERNDVT